MRLNANLQVRDVPGTLIRVLEPLSALDANIVGVVHDRESMAPGRIGVNLTFEVSDQAVLDRLLSMWGSMDVEVTRLGAVYKTYDIEYMLIGDISPSILEGMLDDVKGVSSLESVDIRYASSEHFKKRVAYITGRVRMRDDRSRVDACLQRRCGEIGLTVVRGGV